jgi:agmatinase
VPRTGRERVGPVDASVVPRFAGIATFARLPLASEVEHADLAVVGVPFDGGTTYRPGARFGPAAVREASRLLRPYDPGLRLDPFAAQQVVDAGDLAVTPFSITEAIDSIRTQAEALLASVPRLVAVGGDHTIALPLLQAVAKRWGPVALVHFDAHLDTWDTYFDAPFTHGTPFRRAREQGLLLDDHTMHVGLRGPLYDGGDLERDAELGFKAIHCDDLDELGVAGVVARIRERVGTAPVYLSIDIDVLDPAHAPGTGTPEAGGMTSRELLGILKGLAGIHLIGGDVVEVSPAYDHAGITATAAAHVVYRLLGLAATSGPPAPGSAPVSEG